MSTRQTNRLLPRAARGLRALVLLFLTIPAPAGAQLTWPPGPTMRLLIIPTRHAGSPPPPVSRAALQQQLFDGPSSAGTLGEYWTEASGGRLRVTGHVLEWVTAPTPAFQIPARDQAAEVIGIVDGEVDFGDYDNDGPDGTPNSGDDDAFVDGGVALIFAETAVCGSGVRVGAVTIRLGGSPSQALITTADRTPSGHPIQVRAVSSSNPFDCTGTEFAGIGILAHELSHQAFGLTDRYSTQPGGTSITNRRWVVGCWNIMAAGSGWGCGTGPDAAWPAPSLYGPTERILLGWLHPTVVPPVRDQVFELRPAARDGNVLRIPVAGSANEHFLIEYRQQLGFDARLPGSGVLIYSVDQGIPLATACTGTCRTYYEHLIEADGRTDLLFNAGEGGNRGEASDAFGAEGRRKFAGNTTPSSRTRAGTPATLTIHDIQIDEAAEVARIRLSTAATPAFLRTDGAALTLAGFEEVNLILRVAGGALPYQWTATGLPSGVRLSVFPGTDSVALQGPVTASGRLQPIIGVRDALGSTVQAPLDWTVAAVPIPIDAVFRRMLFGASSPGLTALEAQYLDDMGNRNGRLDVGDARAEWSRSR